MKSSSEQFSLFDTGNDAKAVSKEAEAVRARAQMHAMLDRLRGMTAPPWEDEMAMIMDLGTFQRAKLWLPADEGQALLDEYDDLAVPLYDIWYEKNMPWKT